MSRVKEQTSTASGVRATVRRTPRRDVISINLATSKLRALMVEQSRDGDCCITVYRGSRAELIAAGVPEAAFPRAAAGCRFRVQTLNACCTGHHEILEGALNPAGEDFWELEIAWGVITPYIQGAHPAIAELARMLLIDVLRWAGERGAEPDLWHTFDALAKCPEAEDFKPAPGAPRLRTSPEFREKLMEYASQLYKQVHREGEVFVDDTRTVPARRSNLRLIVDNTRTVKP